MKARYVILLAAMAVELFLFLYCLLRKANHVPAGYLCAVLSLILLFFTGWLLLFPKPETISVTGSYQVAREDDYYTDLLRKESYANDESDRELPVSFWYPEAYSENQGCPLVLFSHGSFGVKESNETLYRELASHGYVVCAIDHTYQCFSTKLSNGKTVRLSSSFVREIASDDPDKDPEQSLVHFNQWMTVRTGDINFVLDMILEKASADAVSVLGLIDSSRICVMGHSLGGSAALGVGRQRNDVSAVISLEAPFLCDIQGVDVDGNFIFDEYDYPVPLLNIYSDASWSHLREWKQYVENARLLEPASENIQNIYFSGIGHFSLTDLSLSSPFLTMLFDGGSPKEAPEETLRKLNEICLEFLDCYL